MHKAIMQLECEICVEFERPHAHFARTPRIWTVRDLPTLQLRKETSAQAQDYNLGSVKSMKKCGIYIQYIFF